MSHETKETVRVQPWGQGQGDFVEINKDNFNPKIHKLYEGKTPSAPPPPAAVNNPPPADGINWADNTARDKAIESGLDFSKVKGTGKKKAITLQDVEAVIAAAEAEKNKINFASDEAGELAAELALTEEDLGSIKGTGENGAITVEDLEKFVDGKEGE